MFGLEPKLKVVEDVEFVCKVKDSGVDKFFKYFIDIREERDWPII